MLSDSHPDRRLLLADRKMGQKALGDKSRVPGLQSMGMYVRVPSCETSGPDVFARLAKGYVVPEKPTKKKEACALNAEVGARISDSQVCWVTWIASRRLLHKLGIYTLPERGSCWDHC